MGAAVAGSKVVITNKKQNANSGRASFSSKTKRRLVLELIGKEKEGIDISPPCPDNSPPCQY